jgi:hypothetical protein
MNKRLALALLAGATAFTAVSASAASLGTITSTSVGAGNVTVASCDTDGVGLSYTTAYDATLGAHEIDTVTVSGISDGCDGKSLKVALVDTNKASLGEVTVTVTTGTATSEAVAFASKNVGAASVTGSHVVISG